MKTKQILIETILITGAALLGMVLVTQAKTMFALLPPLYLLVERHVRTRTWADLGLKFSSFREDLHANWLWFGLVGIISQPLCVVVAKIFFPPYLEHIVSRLPFPKDINWFALVPILAFSLIAEEMTFRSMIQGRLTPFIGKTGAILLASLLFGVTHFSPGVFFIVFLDITGIFINSILYGIIYAHSGNLIVTWLAHLLGDVLGILCLILSAQGQ
jgi:membrane protease YdiL (CAAX protease family)